jgi:hypothetical protein
LWSILIAEGRHEFENDETCGTQINVVHILTSDRWIWKGIMASGWKRRGWILHLVVVLTVLCFLAEPVQGDNAQAQMWGGKTQAVTAQRPESPAEGDRQGHPPVTTGNPSMVGRIELKREFTNRATPEESSKTTLRVEAGIKEGLVSLLRIDIPFLDKKTGDYGHITKQGLGDIKFRVGFSSIPLGTTRLNPLIEVTFPTAVEPELGSGQLQLVPGLRLIVPIPLQWLGASPERLEGSFETQVQQFFSVLNNEDFKAINYTKLEFTLRTVWLKRFWLSLMPKMALDWEQDKKTGGVLELEGGWKINLRWRTWLKLGHGLWGVGVPSTYGTRTEIGVGLTF